MRGRRRLQRVDAMFELVKAVGEVADADVAVWLLYLVQLL